MELSETIAQTTQDLLNLIMLRERDFFLKSDLRIKKGKWLLWRKSYLYVLRFESKHTKRQA